MSVCPSQAAPADDSTGSAADTLSEVVVTARKRTESIVDAPESITAFGAGAIQDFNIQTFADYATKVPNLAFSYGQTGLGATSTTGIAIRGISGAGTTGFYIDDTSVSTSINPRVVDIDRIEVLEGPQGTLYGASSMGGNVRLITTKPNFEADSVSYMAQGGATSGGGSADYGGDVRGNYIAIPGFLAVRAMLFDNHDAGFLTRTYPAPGGAGRGYVSNQDAIKTYGGSLAALMKMSDRLDVTFRFLTQDQSFDGLPEAYAPLPQFKPVYILDRTTDTQEAAYSHFGLGSIEIGYRGDAYSLSSSTSYYYYRNLETEDATEGTDEFLTNFFGAVLPPDAIIVQQYTNTRQVTEETRLSATVSDAVSFISGVYFSREWTDSGFPNAQVTGLAATGLYPTDQIIVYDATQTNDNAALFGELYYKFLRRFTLTLGGRYFYLEQQTHDAGDGFFLGGPTDSGNLKNHDTGFSPKAALAYALNDDTNVYALFSKGFRAGGPQAPVPPVCQSGLTAYGLSDGAYRPDTVKNYEVGAKSSLLNGRAYVTASGFQIDWNDIQQNVVLPCGAGVRANTGEGRIRGGELQLNGKVLPGLDIRVGVGYEQAIITNPGATPILTGERIFQVPRINGTAGFHYSFGDQWQYRPFVAADYSYVGDRLSANNSAQNAPLDEPSYSIVNARLGVAFGKSELNLYMNNLTNEKANLGDIQQIAFPQSIKNASGQTVPYLEVGVLAPTQVGVQFKQSF
jgi:outer membrane receptor protein involved in Fe transport